MNSTLKKEPFVFIDMIKKPEIKQRQKKTRSNKPIVCDCKNMIVYKRTTKQMKMNEKNANSNLLQLIDKQYSINDYCIITSELIKNSDGDVAFIKSDYQELYPKNNDIDRKIRETMSDLLKQGYFYEFKRGGQVTRKAPSEWNNSRAKKVSEKKKPKETKYLSEIAFNKWVKEENPSDLEIQEKLDNELWYKIAEAEDDPDDKDHKDVTYNKWINNGEPVTVNKYPIF